MLNAKLEVHLYGVTQLRRDGVVLHVGARKSLAILALLAVDGATSRHRLATLLWPELAAGVAQRNLRQELFRLRKFGVALQTHDDRGLALPDTLAADVQRLRNHLAAGDDARALAVAAPVALDGLDGVAGTEFDAWLERTRKQLSQARTSARIRLAAQLEAAGEDSSALALHAQALAEDPCDEQAARAAMRLHAALGQTAQAAALYRRLAKALRDELDIEPDAVTVALAQELGVAARGPLAALAQPAAMPPRQGTVAQASALLGHENPRQVLMPPLVPEQVPFVGRAAERARLDAAIRMHRRVYLSGVAGSGKSRLAAECASARGAWLRVACAPTDPGLAYASATRVLRALHEAAPGTLLPEWVRRELAWLLPELGAGPQPVAGAEAGERLRAAFAGAWQQLAAEAFDTIVLDDWHWADDASVELWQRVEPRSTATLIVFRSAQMSHHALARLREDLAQGVAEAIEIEGLSADDTLGLVHALSRPEGGTLFARRLHQATGGHPFHLVETLRHLADSGQLRALPDGRWVTPFDETTADYAELPVPASVREVVLNRVHALGEPARRLLEAASLLGDAFDARLLEGIVPLAADERVQRLEHAVAARLLAADGQALRFAHDLIRHCLQASLSPARRQLLHSRLAQRLAELGAEPARVAQHLEAALDRSAAVTWRRRAAEQAWRAHALAETMTHGRQALDDGAAGADAVAVHRLLAEVERSRGNAEAVMAAFEQAVRAARGSDARTRIDIRLAQLHHWVNVDRNDEVLAALDALAPELATAPPALRARALQLRALVRRFEGRHDEARRLDDEAIALADADPQAAQLRAQLLDAAARTALAGNDLARGEALAERAVAAAQTAPDDATLSRSWVARGVAALYARNDRATAIASFEQARRLAARIGHVPQQRAAILNLVKCHADAGELERAISLLDEGETLAPGYEHLRAELAFREARYYVHYQRGDLDAARRAAAELVAAARRVDDRQIRQSAVQLVLDVYLHGGELDIAGQLLDEAGASHGSVQHAVLVAKRAWLLLARGDARAALAMLASLEGERRVEDDVVIAWVAAASSIALGDLQAAASQLAAIRIDADHAVDGLAMVLVQRLRLARLRGEDDAPARERAFALLPRVPAIEAALLEQALA